MGGIADAVKNGPKAKKAKVGHLDAQIATAEAKATKAADLAKALRTRAKAKGPLAKVHAVRADVVEGQAAGHRKRANQLKVAKAKLAEREAKQALREAKPGRYVASTKAAGLAPVKPGQPGQAKKSGGGQAAKPKERAVMDDEPAIRSRRTPTFNQMFPEPLSDSQRRFFTERDSGYTGWLDQDGRRAHDPFTNQEGIPAMTVSGEAVNVEATEAMLDTLKSKVAELRSAAENSAGSLASGGLAKLAGSLSKADDALASVDSDIAEAKGHLANQRDIAEAVQVAGEMHSDASFYGG